MSNNNINAEKVYAQLKALYLLTKEKGVHPKDREEKFRGGYFELTKRAFMNEHILTIRVDANIDSEFCMAYVHYGDWTDNKANSFHYYVCKDYVMYQHRVTPIQEVLIDEVYDIFIGRENNVTYK